MSKPLDTLNSETDAKPMRLPPIRILDFMVLTAAMSFIFMLQERMDRNGSSVELNPVFDFAFRLAYAIPAGISIAAIYWLVNQKRVTGRFFVQPGHWALAAFSIRQVGSSAVWFFSDEFINNRIFVLFGYLFLTEISAFVFLLFGTIKNRGIWRWLLASVAAVFAFTGLSYIAVFFQYQLLDPSWNGLMLPIFAVQILSAIAYITGIVLLLIAIIRDFRHKISRDWLHWVGAIMIAFYLVITPIMTRIFSYLFTLSPANNSY